MVVRSLLAVLTWRDRDLGKYGRTVKRLSARDLNIVVSRYYLETSVKSGAQISRTGTKTFEHR